LALPEKSAISGGANREVQKMKTLGIVGGVGPESTMEYYRRIITAYQRQAGEDSYPHLIINSIDVNKALRLIGANDLTGFAQYFIDAVNVLANAGADLALISANTPHIVFDQVASRVSIRLLSIVESMYRVAKHLGLRKPVLLGTSFTMRGRFYPDVFSKNGIALVTPAPDEQSAIHRIYIDELLKGIVRPESRNQLLAVIRRMRQNEAIDGVILAGTELSLILQDSSIEALPVLDTTQIHVTAAVNEILG
jgi:aspartate racemase